MNLSQAQISIGIADLAALLTGQAVHLSIKPEDVDLGQFGKLQVALVDGGVSLQIVH